MPRTAGRIGNQPESTWSLGKVPGPERQPEQRASDHRLGMRPAVPPNEVELEISLRNDRLRLKTTTDPCNSEFLSYLTTQDPSLVGISKVGQRSN